MRDRDLDRRDASPPSHGPTARPDGGADRLGEDVALDGVVYERCETCGTLIARKTAPEGGPDGPCRRLAGGRHLRKSIFARERTAPYGWKRCAQAYDAKLRSGGCGGICVMRDTQACGGDRCQNCEVHAAGLCCKRYLLKSGQANVIERDGGDYRSLAGEFIKRKRLDSQFDEAIRRGLELEMKKVGARAALIERQLDASDDLNLALELREYTLSGFLERFTPELRRPVRIEVQLLLYIFRNYMCQVGLEHAETRFAIPRDTINRYLRAYFGCSYSVLLSCVRNAHSKTLLSLPMLRIGEIGALVGYKSHYHYSLSFKRYEGISPKEYRHELQEAGKRRREAAYESRNAEPVDRKTAFGGRRWETVERWPETE